MTLRTSLREINTDSETIQFLFSKYGQKYLKALLEYHVVANQTLYSDAYYKSESIDDVVDNGIPKGIFHVSRVSYSEPPSNFWLTSYA